MMFTQAGKRAFDDHYMGVAILSELLNHDGVCQSLSVIASTDRGQIYWVDPPPESNVTKLAKRNFASGTHEKAFRKILSAMDFYFRAYHQLPNTFYSPRAGSNDEHETWLCEYSQEDRLQQTNASAANLPSDAKGLPFQVHFDPIERAEWLLPGENDGRTTCQDFILVGQKMYAGSILQGSQKLYIQQKKQDREPRCNKSFYGLGLDALQTFQIDCRDELNTYLARAVTMGQNKLVEWGAFRSAMGKMRRLAQILERFPAAKIKQAGYTAPDDLEELVDAAENIQKELSVGIFKLGDEPVPRMEMKQHGFESLLHLDSTTEGRR